MFLRIKRLSTVTFLTTGVALKTEKNVDIADKSYLDDLSYDSLTPWERVKEIFKFQTRGGHKNEDTALIMNGTIFGTLFGFAIGTIKNGQKAFNKFVENNDATKFANPYEAKSKLTNEMALAMIRGGSSLAIRFGFFIGTYTLVSTCGSVYRGKYGILEHIIAGSVVGTLYRINYGFKGMLVGCALGCVAGTIYGVSTFVVFKMLGINFQEMRRENYNLHTWTYRQQRKFADKYTFKERPEVEQKKILQTKDLPMTLEILPDEQESKGS